MKYKMIIIEKDDKMRWKMNKKGEQDIGGLLWDNIIYLILVALFVFGMFAFVQQQRNGAGIWEDYYAKEITKMIELSSAGDEIEINVQKGSEVAKENRVSFSEIFVFDNVKNEICVKLNIGRKTCYFYNKDVDIINPELKLGVSETGENSLYFKVDNNKRGVKNE